MKTSKPAVLSTLLRTLLLASLLLPGCGSGGSNDGGDSSQPGAPCAALCACAANDGVDVDACVNQCKQTAVAATTPVPACVNALAALGATECSGECSNFTDPAPGDMIGQCADSSGALEVGQSVTCQLGGALRVDYLALSVGCNDGETGTFTAVFDDGTSVDLFGDCGTAMTLAQPVVTSSITLTMNSGGGADENISFSDNGSEGLFVGYR